MADALKKFGKYFLLDLLAQGGMAEIYRARMSTPDGGARLVAIKRVLASYSQNPEFVQMFKGEIKTTSGFTHPNIVQIYDFGELEGQLYLSMELVDGRNLRQFINRSIEEKKPFPVEQAAYVAEQAAAGLSYAHGYKDKFSGKPLNLVHRDVSPQNVLVSYDGAVKVIDFGIAKAVTNSESTRAGVIKGKPSYLSPEQIVGDELDGRSDIFALGIVLWEALTGRRLFAGDNDYAVIKLIENSTAYVKPPSTHNPKAPKELDAIVMKCLEKDRNRRYGNADELHRALRKFLNQYCPDFAPNDLANYARDLFKNEIVEDRQKFVRLNERAEQLLSTMESDEESHTRQLGPREQTATVPMGAPKAEPKGEGSKSFKVIDFNKNEKSNIKLDFESAGKSSRVNTRSFPAPGTPVAGGAGFGGFDMTANPPATSRPAAARERAARAEEKKSRKSPLAAAVFLIAALGAGYYYFFMEDSARRPAGGAKTPPTLAAALAIEGNVTAATVTVNDKVVASALPASVRGLPAGQALKVSVSSNGYLKSSQDVTLAEGETRALTFTLAREPGAGQPEAAAAAPTRTVPVRLNIQPAVVGAETKVRINGDVVDPLTAVGIAPVGAPFEVVVEREGFRAFRKTITIDAGKLGSATEYAEDIRLTVTKFGYLSIKTTPSADAMINIDGAEEKIATPVTRRRVPVGTYKIKLVNTLLGMEKTVEVSVAEDRLTNVEERLSVAGGERAPGSK
ncbi:MAG: protein kinase [Deltaproteobacteria bacterium]|nr:protein kinase [Deltaproteobacteria bacterium]